MLLSGLNDWSSIGRSFLYLFVLVAIMALAYILTRLLNTKVRGYPGGNLKVIEGVGVGQNGSVVLLKAGSKFILVGVTRESVSYLTDFSEADINMQETVKNKSFESYLSNFLKGKKSER